MNSKKVRVPLGFEEVSVFLKLLYHSWSIGEQKQPTISLRWSTGGDLVRGRYVPNGNKIYCVCSNVVIVPITIERSVGTVQDGEGSFSGIKHRGEIKDYVEAAVFIIGVQLWKWLVKSGEVVGDSRDTKANTVGFILLGIFRNWKELKLDRIPEAQELLELGWKGM